MKLGEKGLCVLFSGLFVFSFLKSQNSFFQTKSFIDTWYIEQMKAQGQDAIGEEEQEDDDSSGFPCSSSPVSLIWFLRDLIWHQGCTALLSEKAIFPS